MKQYNIALNYLQLSFIKQIKDKPLSEFKRIMYEWFTIKQLCQMTQITRDHYNYLKRTKKLDRIFLVLKECDSHV